MPLPGFTFVIRKYSNSIIMKPKKIRLFAGTGIVLIMMLSLASNIGNVSENSILTGAALGTGINLMSPWKCYRADAVKPYPRDSLKNWKLEELKVEDNQLLARYKDRRSGKPHTVEMAVREGEVRALVIDGTVIPGEQFDKHRDIIDMTLKDVRMAREELAQAWEGLEDFDAEEIRIHIKRSLEDLKFPEPPHVHFEFDSLDWNFPGLDSSFFMKMHIEPATRAMEDINREEIRIPRKKALKESQKEMEEFKREKGMSKEEEELHLKLKTAQVEMGESIREAMEEIDWEEIREAQRKALEEIDWEAIKKEQRRVMEEAFQNQEEIRGAMEEARQAWEEIDHEAIREEIRRSMENLEFEELHLQEEMEKLEKQLEEIDKLGLEKNSGFRIQDSE